MKILKGVFVNGRAFGPGDEKALEEVLTRKEADYLLGKGVLGDGVDAATADLDIAEIEATPRKRSKKNPRKREMERTAAAKATADSAEAEMRAAVETMESVVVKAQEIADAEPEVVPEAKSDDTKPEDEVPETTPETSAADLLALPTGFPSRQDLISQGYDTVGKVRAASFRELEALDNIGVASIKKIQAAVE